MSAVRFERAESVRTNVDENVGGVGAACRDPLFHSGQQSSEGHAVADGSERKSQRLL